MVADERVDGRRRVAVWQPLTPLSATLWNTPSRAFLPELDQEKTSTRSELWLRADSEVTRPSSLVDHKQSPGQYDWVPAYPGHETHLHKKSAPQPKIRAKAPGSSDFGVANKSGSTTRHGFPEESEIMDARTNPPE